MRAHKFLITVLRTLLTTLVTTVMRTLNILSSIPRALKKPVNNNEGMKDIVNSTEGPEYFVNNTEGAKDTVNNTEGITNIVNRTEDATSLRTVPKILNLLLKVMRIKVPRTLLTTVLITLSRTLMPV